MLNHQTIIQKYTTLQSTGSQTIHCVLKDNSQVIGEEVDPLTNTLYYVVSKLGTIGIVPATNNTPVWIKPHVPVMTRGTMYSKE